MQSCVRGMDRKNLMGWEETGRRGGHAKVLSAFAFHGVERWMLS